jgi:hypothetical protein
MWDGKEYVSWKRFARRKPGHRAAEPVGFLGAGLAEISSQPTETIPPSRERISVFFEEFPQSFAETVPGQNPKLKKIVGDTIHIETGGHKFEFSKKISALKRIDFIEGKEVYKTYKLSDHVESSGIWIPLRIVLFDYGNTTRGESTTISVDPKTLRLRDSLEDTSIFNEALPAGCGVNDKIRQRVYVVPTADEVLEKWDMWMQVFKKSLKQVQEHKDAIRDCMFLLWLLSPHAGIPDMQPPSNGSHTKI